MKNKFTSLCVLIILILPLQAYPAEPEHKMIDLKFYKCEHSKNLEGGIYGKGPFKKFGPENADCKKEEWIEIDKEEFKRLSTLWYGYDWSSEIPFWRQ